jgi:DNA helicase II / ATP-dependent DNA helicase PcrA
MSVVYHTNSWAGDRRTGQHWAGDLPANAAHQYLTELTAILEKNDWNFSPENTKVLMLTHNVLAEEQGYKNFADVFDRNDLFIKKEDKYVAFFVNVLEPLCIAYKEKRYGEMFSVLGGRKPHVISHQEKQDWAEAMDTLLELRESGSVADVLGHLRNKKHPRLPEQLEKKEQEFEEFTPEEGVDEPNHIARLRDLRSVAYAEVVAFARFSNSHTPFATKHSVKGAEFENVLVVLGRGWNQYNFGEMLGWLHGAVPPDKLDRFERARNLFYVCCSRPQKRLALLFTQELSGEALCTLDAVFDGRVHALPQIR